METVRAAWRWRLVRPLCVTETLCVGRHLDAETHLCRCVTSRVTRVTHAQRRVVTAGSHIIAVVNRLRLALVQ